VNQTEAPEAAQAGDTSAPAHASESCASYAKSDARFCARCGAEVVKSSESVPWRIWCEHGGIDDQVERRQSVGGMKRLASRSTWWHRLPHKSELAVNAAERKGQPWTILASNVHKRESQICILAEGGELIEQRIRTEPERFAAVLGARPISTRGVVPGSSSRQRRREHWRTLLEAQSSGWSRSPGLRTTSAAGCTLRICVGAIGSRTATWLRKRTPLRPSPCSVPKIHARARPWVDHGEPPPLIW
jgi:hypothetical protein